MGNCASSHSHFKKRPNNGTFDSHFPSVKVVHPDGQLQEFRRPTTAAEIIGHHPNCFLCSSDTMPVHSYPPQVPPDHVLQLEQIYFLLPLPKSISPLSLQDLCSLAIKASATIKISSETRDRNEKRKKGRFGKGNYRDISVTF